MPCIFHQKSNVIAPLIPRKNLSRPVRLALEAEVFQEHSTFFDYGCGYGGDIQRLAEQGIQGADGILIILHRLPK